MPFAGTLDQQFPHYSTGPTLVEWHGELGYAEDKVQIAEQPFWHEVHADSHGGAEGPPCDVQYIGSLVYVTCLLNRFNEANLRVIGRIAASKSTTDGTMPPTGWYMRQDSGMEQLTLTNKSYTLSYPKAILKQGRSFNAGTRHQAFALTFECHVNNPCDAVLFTYGDGDDPCS
jgi:hypothetical protein